MSQEPNPPEPAHLPLPRPAVARAYAVHLLTAGGILFHFLAAIEIARDDPRPVRVFLWFIAATLVDTVDGPLARKCHVKRFAPRIDGRAIDDIVDYIGFTFLPLLLVWRMGWVPGPHEWSWLWVSPPLVASLLGFANLEAKDESGGFFRGFPSYWNILALYLGLLAAAFPAAGPWANAGMLLFFAGLTVAPVWFVYPNRAPRPWRVPVVGGALLWTLLVVAMLPYFPHRVPGWLTLLSLLYPAFYIAVSIHLWRQSRNAWIAPA